MNCLALKFPRPPERKSHEDSEIPIRNAFSKVGFSTIRRDFSVLRPAPTPFTAPIYEDVIVTLRAPGGQGNCGTAGAAERLAQERSPTMRAIAILNWFDAPSRGTEWSFRDS